MTRSKNSGRLPTPDRWPNVRPPIGVAATDDKFTARPGLGTAGGGYIRRRGSTAQPGARPGDADHPGEAVRMPTGAG